MVRTFVRQDGSVSHTTKGAARRRANDAAKGARADAPEPEPQAGGARVGALGRGQQGPDEAEALGQKGARHVREARPRDDQVPRAPLRPREVGEPSVSTSRGMALVFFTTLSIAACLWLLELLG